MIQFFVPGKPQSQGSKRWVGRMIEANKDLAPWRATVTAYTLKAIRAHGNERMFIGPVTIRLEFYFARPKAHYGTGKNAGKLKPNAPTWVSTTPDADKLVRAICDGITDAGLWQDDSLVVEIHAVKMYAEQPGVLITVEERK